ncbi:ESF1 homolog [Sitophilus oryzae]|uniref:ESF1 homolog n=1 Tax=Sitophilus oryzae TaxID=7048 RepID=A0A6J2YVR6_SITOR|nr:ESF1 homolog [Sitophilus oryzae]
MEDKRFSHIAKDPKFRRIPKNETKVKIDKRFHSMFTDKKFQVKYTVDKRGRPVKHHSKEDLKRYYEVSSEDEDSDEEQDLNESGKYVRASENQEISDSETDVSKDNEKQLNSKHINDKKVSDDVKAKLRDLNIDYARGEQNLYSDSSSDDEESDDEVSESEEIDHRWGELDADSEKTDEVTDRLAACNLDWDRIRAVDLLMLFNSFLPPGGIIHSVAIYPSEFGKQRMSEEDIKGPIELVDSKKEHSDEETEEGSKYHMEKLRQYQLNRLKYYYAVITFDSGTSANKIYTECDGMEYESSATKIDLRFIPNDMTFEDDPKEFVDKLPEKYEPRFFTTTALQQAKVDLTWDETNPERLEFTDKLNSGKIDEISEDALQNFLGGSNSEEDSNESSGDESESENVHSEDAIQKYKALLQDIQEKEDEKKNKKFEMEISWDIDAKAKADKIIKEKTENSENQTPFQKYLDKRKEKRKEKRESKKKSQETEDSNDSDFPSDIDMNDSYFAEEFNNKEFSKKSNKKGKEKYVEDEEDKQKQAELSLLLMNNDESEKSHFSLKKIQDKESQSKNKKKKYKKEKVHEPQPEDNFEVNVEDNRFSALFTSHHFNIDPTDSHYKKTKGMDKLIQEKLKRRNEDAIDKNVSKKLKVKNNTKNSELRVLVKNVKRKTLEYNNK